SANANEWTKPLSIKDWTYGQTPSQPSAQAKYGSDRIQYAYFDKNGNWIKEVPENAGEYYVYAYVLGTPDYEGLKGQAVSFEIRKAENEWTIEPSVKDIVYGQSLNPIGEAKHGTVKFEYAEQGSSNWSNEAPTQAGTYQWRAVVEGLDNYNDLTASGSVTIAKKA
ncbi:hypothetical protein C815_00559, partial [Firmicutes bacterium M10-2]